MGKQVKGDHIPEPPPLDDDVYWMPLLEAVARLVKQTSPMRVALPRIEKKMEGSKLPSMREDLATGAREHLQPEFWKANIIYYEEVGRPYVHVFPGPKDKRRWNLWASDPRDEDGGQEYFVSRSDFERHWPSPQQARDGDAAPPVTRSAPPAKPGTKPQGDWPTKVGAWLILKACENPRQLENIDALVRGAQDHLQDEIGWAPENTGRIRTQILDFLELIRR
jgi:hypothetical protein